VIRDEISDKVLERFDLHSSRLFPSQVMTLRTGDENDCESMDVNVDIFDD
jgi:hypothetical protein